MGACKRLTPKPESNHCNPALSVCCFDVQTRAKMKTRGWNWPRVEVQMGSTLPRMLGQQEGYEATSLGASFHAAPIGPTIANPLISLCVPSGFVGGLGNLRRCTVRRST